MASALTIPSCLGEGPAQGSEALGTLTVKEDPESSGSLHSPVTEEGPEGLEGGKSCLSPEEAGLKSRERQKWGRVSAFWGLSSSWERHVLAQLQGLHIWRRKGCGLPSLCSTCVVSLTAVKTPMVLVCGGNIPPCSKEER